MNPASFKRAMVAKIDEALNCQAIAGEEDFEVTAVPGSSFLLQLRLRPKVGGGPRYFLVRVSEQL